MITTEITINGNGSTVERSSVVATPQFRIFRVAGSGILVLNALTLKNGDAANSSGGAVRNDGSVIINDSTITQNTANNGGGIRNDGTLTLDASTVIGNTSARDGGGINNSSGGTLTLSSSTVSGNTSIDANGGGIYNRGASTLINVTLSGNSSSAGGGIRNSRGTISLINTIVANNTSGGDCSGTIVTLGHNLDSDATCGLDGPGDLPSELLEQKISATEGGFTGVLDDDDRFGRSTASLGDLDGDGVADLAVGAYRDDDGGTDRGAVWVLFMNADGTVKSNQKISDTAGGFAGALDDGDLFGVAIASLGDLNGDGVSDLAVGARLDDDGGTDRGAVWILYMKTDGTVKTLGLGLGPLQDNGGPTFTHAPRSGSPAIDAGDDLACPATDQRGVPRPRDGDGDLTAICDIGAYEFGFRLTGPTPGHAGVMNTIEAAGAPPGREIAFIFGSKAAPPAGVPGCPGTTVDIRRFKVLGTVASDAGGDASLSRMVPSAGSGQTVRLQAVELVSCQVSNAVVHTFP